MLQDLEYWDSKGRQFARLFQAKFGSDGLIWDLFMMWLERNPGGIRLYEEGNFNAVLVDFTQYASVLSKAFSRSEAFSYILDPDASLPPPELPITKLTRKYNLD